MSRQLPSDRVYMLHLGPLVFAFRVTSMWLWGVQRADWYFMDEDEAREEGFWEE